MKVLVTGSKGFIGKNLVSILQTNSSINEILEYDRENTFEDLEKYCIDADAVFHLAAVLRPEKISGFDDNIDLTSRIMNNLKAAGNKCPVMFASSIQADLDNPYGQCKRIEESKFIDYGKKNNVNSYVFRFPNLFGKMSRPNYTSVIATFCYNTVKGLPITVNNPATQMRFAFVNTVLEYVTGIVLENRSNKANQILQFDNYYLVGLGELVYYMEALKLRKEPTIVRNDDFFKDLKKTFNWYEENYAEFEE